MQLWIKYVNKVRASLLNYLYQHCRTTEKEGRWRESDDGRWDIQEEKDQCCWESRSQKTCICNSFVKEERAALEKGVPVDVKDQHTAAAAGWHAVQGTACFFWFWIRQNSTTGRLTLHDQKKSADHKAQWPQLVRGRTMNLPWRREWTLISVRFKPPAMPTSGGREREGWSGWLYQRTEQLLGRSQCLHHRQQGWFCGVATLQTGRFQSRRRFLKRNPALCLLPLILLQLFLHHALVFFLYKLMQPQSCWEFKSCLPFLPFTRVQAVIKTKAKTIQCLTNYTQKSWDKWEKKLWFGFVRQHPGQLTKVMSSSSQKHQECTAMIFKGWFKNVTNIHNILRQGREGNTEYCHEWLDSQINMELLLRLMGKCS